MMNLLARGSKVHLIGIGGSGLSAIARVLHQQGIIVSGSDRQGSPLINELKNEGILVYEGHCTDHVKDADFVVRSSAIKDDNPEVQEARRKGIPVLKRSDILDSMMAGKKVIAVAGTHGKTTTTTMLAWVLTVLGKDPSYIIGGVSRNLGTNAHAGKGEYFVIEADEYDGMFLGLHPHLAVITNIEYDHPDCYPTEEDFYQAFKSFTNKLTHDGILVLCAENNQVPRLYDEIRNSSHRIFLYGREGKANSGDAAYKITDIEKIQNDQISFQIVFRNQWLTRMNLRVHGDHNVLNAAGVAAAIHQLGLPVAEASQALSEYKGSGRRFDIRGIFKGVPFIDDYAHHPTEIKAAINAARSRFSSRKIWVVWQPHTYSRVMALYQDFLKSFDNATRVLVMDVYAAREIQPQGFDILSVVSELRERTSAEVVYAPTKEDVVRYLTKELNTQDAVVLILSAGDANEIIPETLKSLEWGRETLSKDQKPRKSYSLEDELQRLFKEKVHFNKSLKPYTTLQVGGNADVLIEADSRIDLIQGSVFAWANQLPLTILGAGSNVLISDRGIRGIVVLNRANKVEFYHDDETAWVWAESGANFSRLARAAEKQELSGLEWAAGIPGTFGGAVVGNAGAHGGDISSQLIVAEILQRKTVEDVLAHLTIEDKLMMESLSDFWPQQRMGYTYRSSLLKENRELGIVLSARLRLYRGEREKIKDRMEKILARRKEVQPNAPNMGSVFKNPPNGYAGQMIEACGLKGKKIGGAQVSEQHANFFVNTGGATAADFWALICHVQEAVQKQLQVTLTLEIERLGEWNL